MTLDMTMGQYLQFVILPYVGIFCLIVFPAGIIIFWKKMLPDAAKMLYRAKRQNKPPLLVVNDAGQGEITLLTARRGNGVMMTEGGKYQMLPRYVSKTRTLIPPQPLADQPVGNPVKTVGTPVMKVTGYDRIYTDYVNKRCNLKSIGLPFFVGYTGSLNLLNPDILALYEAGEIKVPTTEGMKFNPKNVPGKNVDDASQPIQLLDPRVIKELINGQYDPTQFAAAIEDAKLEERMGKGFGRYTSIFVIIGVIVAAIVVVFFMFG